MAKRIKLEDRLGWARLEIQTAGLRAETKGQRQQIIGMNHILRIFEGESDEAIKAFGIKRLREEKLMEQKISPGEGD